MKIVIIAQEEAVYFSPLISRIIAARSRDIAAVAIAGERGAGSHPKTLRGKLAYIAMLWLMLEPRGFLRNLGIAAWQRLLQLLGPIGALGHRRSIRAAARRYKIPLLSPADVNSPAFLAMLKRIAPDVIINQTELLLKEDILSIPTIGVVSRHASLLPRFRGRVASWWAHAAEPPEYGVTIHFVDSRIDAGPIIMQHQYCLDPRASYCTVLDALFQDAPRLMLAALDTLQRSDFIPTPNHYPGTPIYRFPSWAEVLAYRKMMAVRRTRGA